MVIEFNTLAAIFASLEEYVETNDIDFKTISKKELVDRKLANSIDDAIDIKRFKNTPYILWRIIFLRYNSMSTVWVDEEGSKLSLVGTKKGQWKLFKEIIKPLCEDVNDI